MYLVHPNKRHSGKWEVAWMWLPHFLASDQELHKYVDQRMTELFKGEIANQEEDLVALLTKMHEKVIDLLVEKYPILGLRQLLGRYSALSPEESLL